MDAPDFNGEPGARRTDPDWYWHGRPCVICHLAGLLRPGTESIAIGPGAWAPVCEACKRSADARDRERAR